MYICKKYFQLLIPPLIKDPNERQTLWYTILLYDEVFIVVFSQNV